MINYKRRVRFVFMMLGLAVCDTAVADARITFQATAGAAVSYIQTDQTNVKYGARILPHAGLSVLIPIEGRCSLKTGIAYEQKGWHAYTAYTDTSDNIRNEFSSAIRLHAIVIPLQLCYTISRGRLQYSVSGGMNYGFFVKAEEETIINTYHKNQFRQTQTLSWNPYIGLIPDDSRLKSSFDGTDYYLFNTAVRAEAEVSLRSRYILQAFWAYTLSDISARVGNTAPLHLGYCGLSLGINLR